MEIELIEKKTALKHLQEVAQKQFGDVIKAVVDIKRDIIAVGGELHADEEAFLLQRESKQTDLWGINIYFDKEDWIEFDSLINIRPSQGNKTRGVEDANIRDKIVKIVNNLIGK